MNFYENWIELDLNPVLSFYEESKISYSNQEAQFLLNKIEIKELYDLSLKYASKSYGSLTTYIDLNLKNYTFYAITVFYENDNEIHMKLYKSVTVKNNTKIDKKYTNMTNIFTLTDLAIANKQINSNIKYTKKYDPSIPNLKINATQFIKALNYIYEYFNNSTNITTSIMLKIGEYIKIENQKYSIVCIKIKANMKVLNKNFTYKDDKSSCIFTVEHSCIIIDLPLIQK